MANTTLMVVLALALPACAKLERRVAGRCGNGVVEPTAMVHEDCDGFADPALGPGTSCVDCKYVCTRETGGCPTGWRCGEDNHCSYPSGAFYELYDSTFEDYFDTTSVADVDGDLQGDLLGWGDDRLWVRFGGGGGRLTQSTDFVFDSGSAFPPSFGDIDRDKHADAVFNNQGNVVVLRGTGRAFEAVSGSKMALQADDGVLALPVRIGLNSPFETLLVLRSTGTQLLMQLMDEEPPQPAMALPEYRSVSQLVGFAQADLDPAAGNGVEVGLVFAGDDRVWMLRIVPGQQVPHVPTTIEPRPPIVLPEPAHGSTLARVDLRALHFGDEDGDGTLDALVSVESGSLAVAPGDGAAGFRAALVDPRLDYHVADAAAVGDLDGDGRVDFVTASSVYINARTELMPRGAAFAQQAVIADFNNDGRPDVATVEFQRREVGILLGNADGYFSPHRVHLKGVAMALAAGDFDGDLVDDVAVAESLDTSDQVSVIYGNATGTPSESVPLGRFAHVEQLQAMTDATSDGNAVSDLLVQSASVYTPLNERLPPTDARAIAVFGGSTRRRMFAPTELGGFQQATHVAIGRFSPDADPAVDLAVFTYEGVSLLVGDGDARFEIGDERFVPVAFGVSPTEYLRSSVADLDRDGVDELVWVHTPVSSNAPQDVFVGHFTGASSAPELQFTRTTDETSAMTVRVDDRVADLDDDGFPDLVVLVVSTQTGDSYLVIYWNNDGTLEATPTTRVLGPADPRAVLPLQLDTDPQLELAVVTPTAVYAADLNLIDGHQLSVGTAPLIPAGGEHSSSAGDVTGDGLDDLILTKGDGATVFAGVAGN